MLRTFARTLWPRRLRSQLTLAVSTVLWLAIVPLGLIALREQSATVLASAQDEAAALARNLALASEGPLVTNELDLIEALILRAVDAPQVQEIRVLDSHGASLSHVVRRSGGAGQAVFDPPSLRLPLPRSSEAQLQTDDANARVVAWHPVVAGTLLGWVQVDQSTAHLQALRLRLLLGTVLACLLAGLGCQVALAWLMRQPLRAIEQASQFAQDLQRIDGQQIVVQAGPQETQALGHSLNQASARLFEMHRSVEHSFDRLRQQEASLADTNEQLRTIFAVSPDGLVSFDAAGLVRFSNDAFHRLTGLTAGQLHQLSLADLEQQLRDRCDAPEAFAGLVACLPADEAGGPAPSAPTRVRLTLSRPRFSVLELSCVRGLAPSATQVLHVRDVTRESEIDRLKSEFLNTAAHELRTPMTSIHACVGLMQMREFDAPGRQKLLGIMQRQSTALVAVVDDLLDLARIESRGAQDLALAPADLGEVVRQAIGDFGVPASRTAPEIQHPAGGPVALGPVQLDRHKTAQVVRNLLSNAYKYSTAGAVLVRLLARSPGPQGPRQGFQVQDHGIGMNAEQLARVCERFYRADASGHVPGTGLGMAIVKDLVTLMGGTLELASTPGQGTSVTVWLPAASTDAEAALTAPPRPAAAPAATPLDRLAHLA